MTSLLLLLLQTWDVVKILEPKHLKEVVDIVGDADSVFSIGRDGFVKKFCGEVCP